MPSALVVDDHPLFCEALALTLRAIDRFDPVRTAGSLQGALDLVSQEPAPDVILLDLNLPDVNGLDGLIRLRRLVPDVPLLIVSSMADHAIIAQALAIGANGFIPKHADRAAFKAAYDAVRAGRIYTPADYVAPQADGASVQAIERLERLTNQQARILSLICEGKLNKQIAFDLSIAETTVKAHVTAIMRKLEVHSRTQAVLVAQEAHFSKVLPSLA